MHTPLSIGITQISVPGSFSAAKKDLGLPLNTFLRHPVKEGIQSPRLCFSDLNASDVLQWQPTFLDAPSQPNRKHFAHLRPARHEPHTIHQVDQATYVDTQEEDFPESIQQSQACPAPDEQIKDWSL